uniref:Sulfate permease, SulP family n=1 Tax=Candidatus Kentrum sp. FM TaxID=2126340 RepID=A0A450WJ58_9GAMM|nr:MAG: sulfate permease, SulP family [Candidatus Kentron sp. FM]VFJ72242.1 MAG: sulfate permease, SulP family [Candidatus Kentron sp. FM]VFK17065.1 MAG: sulfate permease, SulP family [Candidatus Kentron sp. FM]
MIEELDEAKEKILASTSGRNENLARSWKTSGKRMPSCIEGRYQDTDTKTMQIIHGLHFNNLRGDIYGGLTAAVVALPLALAFGVSSGAGPVAGLYGAIFVGFFAAMFGGTPSQISGPTGPMTVVMAAIFTQYTALYPNDPLTGAALAFTVVIMGGAFQIVFGLLGAGRYINLVPAPVISGFMSGIGVIIILLQIGPLLGHPAEAGPLASLGALPEAAASPVTDALILGAMTLAIVYLLPKRLNRILPAPLVALIAGTVVLLAFFAGGPATTIGDIPTGVPAVTLPTFEPALLVDMIKSALILAVLGSIDSLLTSLVADNLTRTYHDSDRELVGQGIGNMVAGFFGGLPGAGATMRTVVNVRAGGQTPISGALHAIVLLAIVLGAGVFARDIPHAVLAGILIKVGTDIIDWDYLKRLHRAPKAGVAMMFTVLLITVFVDLITAVAIGVVMASLVFMKRMTDLQLASITAITDPAEEHPLSEEEARIMKKAAGRILLFHLGGPMSFSAAKGMTRRLAGFDGYDALVLDLSDVPVIDYTTSRAIEDMIADAEVVGRRVFLAGVHEAVATVLEKQRVLDRLAPEYRHGRRIDALEHAWRLLES